jgi:hypothetical protein
MNSARSGGGGPPFSRRAQEVHPGFKAYFDRWQDQTEKWGHALPEARVEILLNLLIAAVDHFQKMI